ncbi:hypothetical protein J2Z31_001742 [Sinorhizobium kostiense]|uniref:Uncharacterized protein n=1 Tax=Sinorhizobium kostiense TaxID=76747 RepID=A0ABS4QX72_9HYPH|nr:hypothetical protein [Sinorhizobium kostiense]MBP2235250.1 hypothetical protein [Sinorhizobium kostiense]
MKKMVLRCALTIASTLASLTVVRVENASADRREDIYQACYREIEAQFGPYTDITWMEKVWKCSEERQLGLSPGSESSATECDFQKRTGSCKGTIRIQSTTGGKGSYSAELLVSSSAPTCSKVEFYLDNTPHQTVLKLVNSAEESVFGTKPISKKSIKIFDCTTYEAR